MNSELLRVLEAIPDWDSMTAHQRTMHYCHELTRLGIKIPAWTAIREHIGKGSPSDIRRAVADFRSEQAQVIKSADQGLAAFPPGVAKLFQKAWLMAIEEARSGFHADRERWEQQLVQVHGDLVMAQNERDAATGRSKDLDHQLLEAKNLIGNLMSQQAALVGQLRTANDQNQQLIKQNGDFDKLVEGLKMADGEKQREIQSLHRQLKKAEERIDSLVGIKKDK